jgi:hypothetical protein
MAGGGQKSMQKIMTELWKKSIEYAILTWRTPVFLRATPNQINSSWYQRRGVTADMVKGIFDAAKEKTQKGKPPTDRKGKGTGAGRGQKDSTEIGDTLAGPEELADSPLLASYPKRHHTQGGR